MAVAVAENLVVAWLLVMATGKPGHRFLVPVSEGSLVLDGLLEELQHDPVSVAAIDAA